MHTQVVWQTHLVSSSIEETLTVWEASSQRDNMSVKECAAVKISIRLDVCFSCQHRRLQRIIPAIRRIETHFKPVCFQGVIWPSLVRAPMPAQVTEQISMLLPCSWVSAKAEMHRHIRIFLYVLPCTTLEVGEDDGQLFNVHQLCKVCADFWINNKNNNDVTSLIWYGCTYFHVLLQWWYKSRADSVEWRV